MEGREEDIKVTPLDPSTQETQVISVVVAADNSSEQEAAEERPAKPVYHFVCEICQEEFTSQLKFFGHLKAHYEDLQGGGGGTQKDSGQGKCASTARNEEPTITTTPLIINNNNRKECETPLPSEQQHQQTPTKLFKPVLLKSPEKPSSDDHKVVGSPSKLLLPCPKCKRTFRREKTFQAHVESCQKAVDECEDDADGSEELEANAKIKVIKKSRAKCEAIKSEVVVEEIVDDGMMEEGLMLEEPVQDHHHLSDDHIFDEEEEEGEGGGGEEILGDHLFAEDEHGCSYCEEGFPSKSKLDLHVKKAHSDEPPPPQNNSKSNKKKRSSSQRRQDVLKCPQCHRIFNHRNSLVYHMRSHTGERPHQCEMCGKSFFATSALKVHMRLHSGEKPYKCENCGRNFRQWGDLKYHMISIHSDIRQYQCEFCGKDFARKYSLIVHRRIHTGERNYKCEFCNKCFRAASYLQNHRRIHTGEKPHACSICGKPFRVRSDMKRHMASHNRESHHHHHSQQQHGSTVISQTSTTASTVHNVVTVSSISNSNQQQIITFGPQISQQLAQVVRGGTTSIQVPVSADGELQQAQQIALEDGNEVVITGDIVDGTPINITLTQEGLTAHPALEGATVATIQPAEIQDGVLYPNREGTLETVTIRESNTGTLYVWPVFMN